MTWHLWIVVAFLAFSAIASVASVGSERKPIEANVAAAVVLFDGFLIWCILRGASA